MKRYFLFLLLVLGISLFLNNCTKPHPSGDCFLDFKVQFISKYTGECINDIDSLLSIYQTDTLFLYSKPNLGGDVNSILYKNNVANNCLTLKNGEIDFDRSGNPSFTYAIGKAPNFIDIIEFKYNSPSVEIKINGVLQQQKGSCKEQIIVNIIK
jgi:hypothetical protein